jgi:CRP-like cAMP-binding protein
MTDDNLAAQLVKFDLFADFSTVDARKIAADFKRQDFAAKDHIIGIGEGSHDVFFLLSGTVKVLTYTLVGNEISLGRLEAPTHFGELTAIDGGQRSAEIVAETDCQTIAVSGDLFREILIAHPEVMLKLLIRFSRLLRESNYNIMLQSSL